MSNSKNFDFIYGKLVSAGISLGQASSYTLQVLSACTESGVSPMGVTIEGTSIVIPEA